MFWIIPQNLFFVVGFKSLDGWCHPGAPTCVTGLDKKRAGPSLCSLCRRFRSWWIDQYPSNGGLIPGNTTQRLQIALAANLAPADQQADCVAIVDGTQTTLLHSGAASWESGSSPCSSGSFMALAEMSTMNWIPISCNSKIAKKSCNQGRPGPTKTWNAFH